MSLPPMSTFPLVALRRPVMTSASSLWPFPATPAMPRISPWRRERETPLRAGRPLSPMAQRSLTSRVTFPFATGFLLTWKRTSRPTIILASSRSLVSAVSTVETTLPSRSTVTLSLTAITSWSLWVMKMTAFPSSAMRLRTEKSSLTSGGVSTEVGSSRMRMLAPR